MTNRHREYHEFVRLDPATMQQHAAEYAEDMHTRRTVREFSSEPVAREIIDYCLAVAMSTPSGANQQPWRFVVVEDSNVRKRIRKAAEAEEREFYRAGAPEEWLSAVEPLGTDASKPFLETAPILICIFAEVWRSLPDGARGKNYYVAESVGIATGFLISALHYAGLATLTHTPSPMRFLNEILGRPENERAFLILVAGLPAANCQVPISTRKEFDEVILRL